MCVHSTPYGFQGILGLREVVTQRSRNLNLGEEMDVGCSIGFEPRKTLGGYLYVHIGA